MKKFFALIMFSCVSLLLFAQDSTDTTGGGSGDGGFNLPPSVLLILGIILGVYEIVIRFIPTVKNYSIIGWIIKLIQTVLPNKSTTTKKLP